MEVGTPDVIASIRGKMHVIETKRFEDDEPTPIQNRRLHEWWGAKAHAVCLKGQEDVDWYLESLQSEIPNDDTP
jgi:hypothetical protein